jgi:AcrR family transcriptional regulator
MARTVKKPEERRADIVEVARRLFGTKGYESTAMQDVMRELGIAKGTIYHYFRSKEELLEAVIEDIVDESVEHMQRAANEASGNAFDKIRVLVGAGRVAEEHREVLDQLHRSDNSGMHARLLAATLQRQAPLYAQAIQQGCDEGVLRTGAPLEAAEFVLTALQFLTDDGIYPWTQETLLRRIRAFPSLIEAQLGAAAGSFDFLLAGLFPEPGPEGDMHPADQAGG